jgi:putative membrane protein
MNGFMHPFGFFGYSFLGLGMLFWWIIFFLVGYLVYQDANRRGMNGLLWFILVILPMVGILFLVLYIIIRESSAPRDRTPLDLLKERYARGEITEEEYKRMKRELEGS